MRERSNIGGFAPSRTFALAAAALFVLVLAGAVLAGLSVYSIVYAPEQIGPLSNVWTVWVGSVATVGAGGAGSMALRDYGSRGMTSSAVHAALSARGDAPTASEP